MKTTTMIGASAATDRFWPVARPVTFRALSFWFMINRARL
jgi:hypothetical protein